MEERGQLLFRQSEAGDFGSFAAASRIAALLLIIALSLAYVHLSVQLSVSRHGSSKLSETLAELSFDPDAAADVEAESDELSTRRTVLCRVMGTLVAGGLLLVAVARLAAAGPHQPAWIFAEIAATVVATVHVVALPVLRLLVPALSSHTSGLHGMLSTAVFLSSALSSVTPLLYHSRPEVGPNVVFGLVQAGLATLLLILLLVTPSPWYPVMPDCAPNPAEKASPLSRHLFVYLEARMLRFYLRPSDIDFRATVPKLPGFLHTAFVRSRIVWDPSSKRAEQTQPTRGSLRTFLWLYKVELMKITVYTAIWIVGVFVSPLSLNLLLRHVQSPEKPSTVSPYVFVLGIFLAPIASSVSLQTAEYSVAQLGLRLRSAMGLAVFLKVLKVREGGGDDESGQVNNLVGTDIDVITSSLPTALQLFGIPPKLIVSLVALYILLGWSAFVALGTVLAFAPLSYYVSKRYGTVQGEIMKATDKRVTLVGELLSAVRIIKMFAYEPSSLARIDETRKTELGRIRSRAKVFAGMMLLSTGIPTAVTLCTFAAYVFGQGKILTASTAFTSMSLFGLLREAVISSTYLVSSFMRAKVSLQRIKRYLAEAEEVDESDAIRLSQSPKRPRQEGRSTTSASSISIKSATFRFIRKPPSSPEHHSSFKLDIGDLKIPLRKTTIIVGDVGSGKTALLRALLGEMHCEQGNVDFLKNSVSYASQAAWLQDDTIKANILFFSEYDEDRYKKVIHQCGLESDLDSFDDGDLTRVGERGLSVSGGQKQRIALARAVYARTDVVVLDDILSALDSNTVSHVIEHCLNGDLLQDRTVILVTHYDRLCIKSLRTCKLVVRLAHGRIESAKEPDRPQDSLSPSGHGMPRSRSDSRSRKSTRRKDHKEDRHAGGDAPLHEEDVGSQISWRVYAQYFGSMGGAMFWTVYAVVNVAAHVLMLGQGYWVSQWVNANGERTAFYFSIYAVIQLLAAVTMTAMYLALIWGALVASRKLHGALAQAVFSAPIRWFDVTPLGAVTNRFTKDTEVIDSELVEQTQPVADYAVAFVAIMICWILPVFLLPAAVISGAFFLVGRLYVRNALATRKEVANARSPLFSTLSDAATGVAIIRAFKRQDVFVSNYVKETDTYNQMQLYENQLERWLQERSDFVGATVSGIVGLLAIRGGLSSGTTGFLVSTGLEFTSRILYVVRAINQQQLSINSAHRIIQYTKIDQEPASTKNGEPPASWPHAGAIEFEGFSARYADDLPDVLRDLNVSIKPGEKVGVVGHSGCGKSTLALALLRFLPTTSGSITVDGRALSSTNLSAIRSRVTLIPQEPTLLSGALRDTLDPTHARDDADLWAALRRSRFVRDDDDDDDDDGDRDRDRGDDGGSREDVNLDMHVAPGGANFSQGQRNLLSLARALVRDTKVCVFDEATASLDNETDKLVQRVLREEFRDATMITIAHRLESIMDFDRVLVLDAGEVVEFDTPKALLDRKDSRFRDMVEATGSFDELYRMAR